MARRRPRPEPFRSSPHAVELRPIYLWTKEVDVDDKLNLFGEMFPVEDDDDCIGTGKQIVRGGRRRRHNQLAAAAPSDSCYLSNTMANKRHSNLSIDRAVEQFNRSIDRSTNSGFRQLDWLAAFI